MSHCNQLPPLLQSLRYIHHPLFEKAEAKHLLSYDPYLDPNAFTSQHKKIEDRYSGLTSYLQSLASYGVLSIAAEQKVFLKFNYLKYLALKALDSSHSKTNIRKALSFADKAKETKDILVCHNLRLVVAIVKTFKHIQGNTLEDYISDGHESILKAVDMFDVSRGYKFSTYLVWSLRMNHWKNYKPRKKDMPPTVCLDEQFTDQHHPMCFDDDPTDNASFSDMMNLVYDLMDNYLTTKEKMVLVHRFGLFGVKPKHLHVVGEELGLTRERIRQIQVEALEILRGLMSDELDV